MAVQHQNQRMVIAVGHGGVWAILGYRGDGIKAACCAEEMWDASWFIAGSDPKPGTLLVWEGTIVEQPSHDEYKVPAFGWSGESHPITPREFAEWAIQTALENSTNADD